MAPLHKINPLRLAYIRDAACRKFDRNAKSLSCLSGLRILDIGCGAGLLCEPFTRLGAQVIGIDPSATNIAAARLHADKGHLSIDYRCTTVEEMDVRERFDIVLAMEVIEHVTDVGAFLARCAAVVKPGGLMVVSTLNRNWKSFALAIVGAEYVLRWLPRGTHQWDKFVTPDELAQHLANNKLTITEQAGVVYNPLADRWSISSDMDVNYLGGQRVGQFAQRFARNHLRQFVERQVDAVVGDAALREIIGADALASVAGADLLLAVRGARRVDALAFGVIDARAQDVHRGGAVLMLRAAVLHHDHDAGRDVGDADRGFGLVDVLAAGALRAHGLDPQIVVLDVDIDILDLGQHGDRSR